jgi:hypothetical protein
MLTFILHMEINWILFIPALVLLFYPLDRLLGDRIRTRDYESVRNDPPKAADAWWRQRWIWVDPLRAFAGAWALRTTWTVDLSEPGLWQHLPVLITMPVLALAIAAQMHTRREDDVFFAPLGYCAGLLFALLPAQVASLVVLFAGACMMGLRNWSAFFFCGALGAGALGYLILRVDFWVAASVLLLLEPLLLGMLMSRKLELPVPRPHRRVVKSREASHSGERVLVQ